MSRNSGFLVGAFVLSLLFGTFPVAAAPIADEVFRQEVGTKIVTEKPVWAVAVWQDVVYTGQGDGL